MAMITTVAQEQIGKDVVDCAIAVHTTLGPGLLESAYEACLAYELQQSYYQIERQKSLPVFYKNLEIENGYRLDLLINNCVIVELKAIDAILPIHRAQLITYLKLSNISLGFLINFNTPLLKDGLQRIVNQHPATYQKPTTI
jgi:GxxExxY protein